MNHTATVDDLDRLLLYLGFERDIVTGSHRVYRHTSSETTVVLPGRGTNGLTSRDHVVAVRRLLVEKGLVSQSSFDALLGKV